MDLFPLCFQTSLTSITGCIRYVSILYLAHGLKLYTYWTGENGYTCTLEMKAEEDDGRVQGEG